MTMSHRRVLLSILLGLAICTRSAGDEQTPGNIPRFSADASALSKAGSAAVFKAGADVVVLDDEENYVFDSDGKFTRTVYLVYKVLTQKGANGWDNISLDWEPWHEERPTIQARVLTPDGVLHPLDPKTISDSPARDDDDQVYGDSRVLRAPLPAIAPGSIVEEEEVAKESAPFFGAGVVVRSYFGRRVPVQLSRLTIDAPSSLPMHYTALLLPDVRPNKTESDGRVKMEFVVGPMDALEKLDDYLPPEIPGSPQVIFATGASWQSVAAGYSKIVDEKAAAQEVQPVLHTLLAGKSTREEKTAAIVQYLSREIRYTGIEFGDAAIVPHTPAETLKRKYGDCKDKATLAVAMLRAAGIPAYVALLNVGSRQDVDKDLPGMGLFDHAIVYVPGDPELWIDATSEYSRVGQVPSSDQGRFALVARPDSTGLLRIPEAASQDNRVIEKREFFLAEAGPARVVETSEPHGVFESEYRAAYADGEDKETKEKLKDYLEYQYLAEKIGPTQVSKAGDLSKQFQLVLEATTAKRGFTEIDSAVAAIRLETLFYWLPSELQQTEKPETKEDGKDDNKDPAKERPKKPRTNDYLLPEAYVCEWQYKIPPPFGFVAKPLPPNAKLTLGPASLAEEFSTDSDGTVRATLRFDTVKRRYSVAEATELRTAVEKLRSAQAITIYFEPRAQALLNQGKTREAFQVTRELIAQHPMEAIHHLQRAKALLAAGMGQAARDEAREAVKIEPTSVLAQKTLAEILEYDVVGRRYRRGSDYAGAEAAFRAAKKLDPDDFLVVGNLAILLEYNHDGERYGPGAPLKRAVAEYQSLKDAELAKIGLQNNLPYALFYAGDYAQAKKSAEALNPQLNAVIVASAAALNGFDQALAEARKRTSGDEDLKSVCKSAGQMLMIARNYPRAAELEDAGASGSNASSTIALASMLRTAKVLRPDAPAENTIPGLMTRMFLDSIDTHLTTQQLNDLYSRNARKVLSRSDPDSPKNPLNSAHTVRASLSRYGFPADVMMDVVMAGMQMQSEGDDTSGYRVTITPAGTKKQIMYVVKEDGQYRILDSAEMPNSIGLEILDRLAANHPAGARILLDWVRDAEHLAGGDDPLSGYAFPRMWTKGKDADPAQMKLAAAAILAQSVETSPDSLPILEPALANAANETDKLNISIALLGAYAQLDEYTKTVALAAQVAKQYPESKSLFFSQEIALRGLGRFAEADQLAQEMTKRLPDDADVMRAFVYTAVAREDYQLARELSRKMIAAGKAEAGDYNSAAWNALFTGVVQSEDLDDATKGAQLTQNSPGVLHTLGCVYAEMNKTKEAREVLIQAMDELNLGEPEDNYWFAFGRIAEQYGETAIASADYHQVKTPKKPVQIPGSSYRLAQNRLLAMHTEQSSKGQ